MRERIAGAGARRHNRADRRSTKANEGDPCPARPETSSGPSCPLRFFGVRRDWHNLPVSWHAGCLPWRCGRITLQNHLRYAVPLRHPAAAFPSLLAHVGQVRVECNAKCRGTPRARVHPSALAQRKRIFDLSHSNRLNRNPIPLVPAGWGLYPKSSPRVTSGRQVSEIAWYKPDINNVGL